MELKFVTTMHRLCECYGQAVYMCLILVNICDSYKYLHSCEKIAALNRLHEQGCM